MSLLEETLLEYLRPLQGTESVQAVSLAADAERCWRQVAYRLRQVPVTEPELPTGRFNREVDRHLTQVALQALLHAYPTFVPAVSWAFPFVTGTADGYYCREDGGWTLVLLRPLNPLIAKGLKEPKREDRLAAHLPAVALSCDRVHLVYISKSPVQGESPLREFIEPVDPDLVAEALQAMEQQRQGAAGGQLLPRRFQGTTITDPATVKWPCNYCSWRFRCLTDGE